MSNITDIDAEDWEREVLQSGVLTVVDFWHERCPWCIMLNPILEEVAKEYRGRVKFVRFNVLKSSRNKDIAIRNGVMGTPTLAFYCSGRQIGSLVGFVPKDYLRHIIEDFMFRYRECIRQSTKLDQ